MEPDESQLIVSASLPARAAFALGAVRRQSRLKISSLVCRPPSAARPAGPQPTPPSTQALLRPRSLHIRSSTLLYCPIPPYRPDNTAAPLGHSFPERSPVSFPTFPLLFDSLSSSPSSPVHPTPCTWCPASLTAQTFRTSTPSALPAAAAAPLRRTRRPATRPRGGRTACSHIPRFSQRQYRIFFPAPPP